MISPNLILILFIVINLILLINFSKIKIFHINIDNPDKKRKFHSKPTPLAGGKIIFFNLIIYLLIYKFSNTKIESEIFFNSENSLYYFILISSIIFLLGFVDDRINLKANFKFFILTLAILTLLILDNNLIIKDVKFSFYERTFDLGTFAIFFSIFSFLVFINAFNMFDGINLQSGFYSLIIFCCIILLYSDSLLVKILIISIICFSYLNFNNKTFLGDSGTLLISFIISVFFIRLFNKGVIIHSDEIFIYLMIPGIDMIRLFFERITKRRHPFSFDRNHIHHLLLGKLSYFNSIFVLIFLISAPIILNFLKVDKLIIIIFSIIIYFLLVLILKRNIKSNQ